ncbi:MAG TPA: 50S ribosomal protein L25/general stress protein Ctc [Longimicrobiales bacterium]
MATDANLKAAPREERGKGAARRLRAAGRVPAVVYGHGEDARPLSVDAHELERLFSRISVENTLIQLEIDGQPGARVLVREVQTHPYRPEVLHVDFYQVHAGERLTVGVPLHLVGTPEGVKMGGVLDQTLHEIEVRCLPDRIPEAIEVDVSGLAVGDSLHIRDVALPEGVELHDDADRTICSVGAPTVAALETEAEAPEGVGGEVQPELVRKREAEAAEKAGGE